MSQSKNPELKTDTVPEEEHPSGDPMPSVKTAEAEHLKEEVKSTYPVRWEYHVMSIQDTSPRLPAEQLSGLGAQGWEMVAVFHLHATINFIFKRFVL